MAAGASLHRNGARFDQRQEIEQLRAGNFPAQNDSSVGSSVSARLAPPARYFRHGLRHVHNDVLSDVSCAGGGDAWGYFGAGVTWHLMRVFLTLCDSSAVSDDVAMGGHAKKIAMVARPRG